MERNIPVTYEDLIAAGYTENEARTYTRHDPWLRAADERLVKRGEKFEVGDRFFIGCLVAHVHAGIVSSSEWQPALRKVADPYAAHRERLRALGVE